MTSGTVVASQRIGSPVSRTVLITGAAGGIGEATTRRLLAAGYQVAISGRHEAQLQNLVSELNQPDQVFPVMADATDYEAINKAVGRTVERFGKLDVVIANAGFSTHDNLISGDPDRWREMVLVNVLGPALLVKAALPALRASRGRIVFLGSVAGFKNTPGNMYSVTKWAATGLAENTRLLVTGDGIGVTLIAPGRVDTPFWSRRSTGAAADGPSLTAEHIADTIAWALDQPASVDINTVLLRPVGQAN
jgi:NADP-dependent 3-hydroxy acid dehydrogenase YdfG